MKDETEVAANEQMEPISINSADEIEDGVLIDEPVAEEAKQSNVAPLKKRQFPHHLGDDTPETETPLFKKHSSRGQLALEFAKAIVSRQGLKSNTKQIVDASFQLADEMQKEIDRSYLEEKNRSNK